MENELEGNHDVINAIRRGVADLKGGQAVLLNALHVIRDHVDHKMATIDTRMGAIEARMTSLEERISSPSTPPGDN